ncbi:MAG: glutamine--fructose-6-phosphate aminotransferase, partial [Nitrososphaerota archaeon]
MCGIAGCISKHGAVSKILFNALKRLEYRGYDSAGMCTINNGYLQIKKDQGKIDEINARLNFLSLEGNIGIAHTRWATHGAPSQVNAHPHVDCEKKIAVVHNGVLENFLEIKQELEARKHVFLSKTDTEVIPHLIEEYLKLGLSFKDAVREACKKLRGSYAIAVICVEEPDKIVIARNESPLVVGLRDDIKFVASDVAAIIEYTNKVIFLENGDMAVVTPE